MTSSQNSDGTPARGRRTAVMADVAKLAGVSHQTVSRVINDNAHVRPETRDRVLSAMRRLGYRPNPAARALVTGRSRTLGVVSFDTTLYGPASTLFAIEQAAHAAGYFLTVVSLLALDRTSVLDAVERIGRREDGIEARADVALLVAAGHHDGDRRAVARRAHQESPKARSQISRPSAVKMRWYKPPRLNNPPAVRSRNACSQVRSSV